MKHHNITKLTLQPEASIPECNLQQEAGAAATGGYFKGGYKLI